jgi:hypothetical protein
LAPAAALWLAGEMLIAGAFVHDGTTLYEPVIDAAWAGTFESTTLTVLL